MKEIFEDRDSQGESGKFSVSQRESGHLGRVKESQEESGSVRERVS
jgi:hypothetical protein